MALIAFILKVPPKEHDHASVRKHSLGSKLGRVDFVGALLMSATVLSFLLVLDVGGEKVSWTSPVIFLLVVAGLASGTLFIFAERSWAKEPIFPLHLLSNRDLVVPYLILMLQTASQIGVSFFMSRIVKLYVLTTRCSSCSCFPFTSR